MAFQNNYEMVLSNTWTMRPLEEVLADLQLPQKPGLEADVTAIELKIVQGDNLARKRKYGLALNKYKAARASIYKILYPGFSLGSYLNQRVDLILPTSTAIENSIINATTVLADLNRPKQIASGAVLAIKAPALTEEVAVHTASGFREVADGEERLQQASDQAVALLNEEKPGAAITILEGAIDSVVQSQVDPALLAAVELNLSAAHLQVGNTDEAIRRADRARRGFGSLADEIGEAQSLHMRGAARTMAGDADRAQRDFDQAAKLIGVDDAAPAPTPSPGPGPRPAPGPGPITGTLPRPVLGPAVFQPIISPSNFNPALLQPLALDPSIAALANRGLASSIESVVRPPTAVFASRDLGLLSSIAAKDPNVVTFRLPGRDEAWGSLKVPTENDRKRADKAWKVTVPVGAKSAVFQVGGNDAINPADVVAQIYAPRKNLLTFADLELRLDSTTSTTFYLTHLYAYGLLVKIGDTHHKLGNFKQAEANYQLAARYTHLNANIEASTLWTRIARNALQWGHAMYKEERIDEARVQYEKLVTTTGQVPAGFLYSTGSLDVPAADARALIQALADRPLPTVNWEIAIYILTAFRYLQQIFDNLDFFGLALSPIHTFEYLQSVARGFAGEAIQAEREFVTFKTREESEEATRRDLETTKAMAEAEADIRFEAFQAAIQEESAARNARDLAVRRHADAVEQRAAYAASSSSQIWAQAAATALGSGEDAIYSEISGLADRLARGETISGDRGLLAAAAVLYGARKTRDYELARMQDNIVELAQAIAIAQDQLDASTRRTSAAELGWQAALQRASMAQSALNAFDDEFFTPDTWEKMADVMRDISRSYLNRAIRIAKLMERAYNFENDTTLKVIKTDYGHGLANAGAGQNDRLLGGDSLAKDIDGFTFHAVTNRTRKTSPIKDVLSLSTEYPAQFHRFLQTGVLSVETDLYEFDRRHPGYFAQRIEAVEVEFIGALPEGGINGTMSLGGVTRYRRQNGLGAERVHQIDTMALSEFTLRGDGFLYQAETGVRGLFQGFGVGATWELRLPRRGNAFDLSRIFDVRFIIYYRATYDPVLHTAILTKPLRPAELAAMSTFSLRHTFPDSWYAFYAGGETVVPLSRFQFPANQRNFTINGVHIRVVPAEGVPAAGIDVRIVGPNGVDGTVTTNAQGVVTSEAAALAGLVGADPLAEWQVAVVGGAAVTAAGIVQPDRIYNIQMGLDYSFEYLPEAI